MHELSMAHSLVQIATAAAQEEGITDIKALHLRLGALSGVIKDALLFSYDIAIRDTLLAGSKLVIEEVPIVVRCQTCGPVELDGIQNFRCPTCNVPTAEIIQGKELEITGLEYDDEAAEAAEAPAVSERGA